jgi:hypothetical protein
VVLCDADVGAWDGAVEGAAIEEAVPKPTEEEAMSSRREVAASSLRIAVVSVELWTGTGARWTRGSCSGLLMVGREGLSPW